MHDVNRRLLVERCHDVITVIHSNVVGLDDKPRFVCQVLVVLRLVKIGVLVDW